jgi:predicted kinase
MPIRRASGFVTLSWLAPSLLVTGIDVILDFGCWAKDERMALRALAHSVGARCEVIYLAVDHVEQRQRIAGRAAQWCVRPPGMG